VTQRHFPEPLLSAKGIDQTAKRRTVEIYFSIVQRKVLTPNDFVDLEEVEQRLLAFERRYEAAATPFEWKFTRQDLRALMARLEEKEIPHAA
jgi:hypothetical protein